MINYKEGDATVIKEKGVKIIVHVCNDMGAWGAGFVLALSAKWKQPEAEYKRIPARRRKLGFVQFIPVGDNTYVANMIGQHMCSPNQFGVPPIRYSAVQTCLKKVADFARSMNNGETPVSIHMPEIGCGLAGGQWSIMEKVVEAAIGDVPATVYKYMPKKPTISFVTSVGSIPKDER
jgi:O-acetyl-ADP-ribose deacetylase (regulator of RNase III)